ncbi:ATPase type 13A [Ostreococcus tauri]|uniref:ATPase type 13A n=1 Tax=Ostreococcus tauri TaxID=70448 RepID=A0A1Y5IDJ8_OSTTA|nr:ATPase type 13A [Ostreococcus tauri]
MSRAERCVISVPPHVSSARTRRRRATPFGRVAVHHVPFILLYVVTLKRCYETSGNPYAVALRHHLDAGYDPAVLDAVGVTKNDGGGKTRDEWGGASKDAKENEWDLGAREDEANDEERESEAEEVKYEVPPTLPAKWLPDFPDVLAFAAVAFAHALLLLAQHWSVRARCFVQYGRSSRVTEGTFLLITPHQHQGKPEIVPVSRLRVFEQDGSLRTMLWCVFQRQRYEYVEVEWDERRGKGRGELREIETPKSLPLSSYVKAKGLTADEVHHAHERFGNNALKVNVPTFWELYKEQLTSPVTVFQIFTVLLWLMDEYWKYALFSALSLAIFEGTTAFSRQKNVATLRGMGQQAERIMVRRSGVWEERSTEELYPGDVISLKRRGGDEITVPCDCVLLSGSAVVNEASLTGESVPQMKECINPEVSKDQPLDMNGVHKVHVLYSGTSLMQHSAKTDSESVSVTIKTPDGGCLCYVVQTGFSSTQGKLMRMMEFSSEQVTGDAKETLILLFILLVFALAASYNVYVQGVKDGKRSQYELVLRCIMIITSVVPPDLPMQTALAVNTALISLVKSQVYCTEPFRVPVAGKVDSCLFDKTGTITSDRLVAEGILCDLKKGAELKKPVEASQTASIVIGGCHALLQIDGKMFGDPLEKAALLGIKWKYDPATHTATPKIDDNITRSWGGEDATSVKILVRNHFASALQRMSIIADVKSLSISGRWSLVKGSPEMIKTLLKSVPEGYDAAYRSLAEEGMRVIALAHRELSEDESARVGSQNSPLTRDEAESNLVFDGFFAFACRVRADSAEVIHALKAASNNVMMATGDATLTALHVGNEVGIARGGLDGALILARGESDKLEWQSARVNAKGHPEKTFPYESSSIPELAEKYSLCVTGKSLNAAAVAPGALWENLDQISIYARMSPDDKERVLKSLKTQGKHTLMCGDGANDVGALKQAHVGVALLSGFGSANTTKVEGAETMVTTTETFAEKMARVKEQAEKMKKEKEIEKQAQMKDRAELQVLQTQWYEEELAARTAAGESWAQFNAMKSATQRLVAEAKRRQAARQKVAGTGQSLQQVWQELEETDGEVPKVKLGDASMAAPFTSRAPSIKATADIVRQGRCTLVSAIQMQQVLMLSCLISAYSLSVLYLDGIRNSENQLMASGTALTVAGLAFSYATPVHTLSSVRPLRSIFHPANFLSLVGQLIIHIGAMVYAVHLVKSTTGEETSFPTLEKVAVVSEAVKKAANETQRSFWEQGPPFEPCLLNTVVFLVDTVQRVCVMLVNYKGRPFMLGALENKSLITSMLSMVIGSFVCAFEVVPWLNNKLQLVSMPDNVFRYKVLGILAGSVVGTIGWDSLMSFIFARHILVASYRDTITALPSFQDMIPFIRRGVAISILLVAYVWSEGNVFIAVFGIQAYRRGYI